MQKYYTISDAARRLGRSRQMLHRWIAEDRVKVTRIGGQPFIADRDCKLPKFFRKVAEK